MVFRLSGLNSSAVPNSTNRALTKYAQARVESEVARAVIRHENALRVDGSDIYLWRRSNAGLICTCRQPVDSIQAQPGFNSIDAVRNPTNISTAVTQPSSGIETNFRLKPRNGVNTVSLPIENLPEELLQNYTGNLDGKSNKFNSITELETEYNDEQLATMLNDGAAIYGGDKTACGICFGTGRTHGYDLATGHRIVLEASGEIAYSLHNAEIEANSHPARFSINSNGYIIWYANLPSYTNGWLNMTIRDNLKPADNLVLEFYYDNAWIPLNVTNLSLSEGSDRSNTQIRVRQSSNALIENTTFTHAELIYSTTKPLLGQCPPLNYMTNYELAEPLITTEFEILANIDDIPRESVFQDSKFKYLWKVIDVTPKITANGQIFSINLNVRRIQSSEALYALKVIFDPMVTVNYRGLELEEGGLLVNNVYGENYNSDNLKFTIGGDRDIGGNRDDE